jgi:hypothetical protein
MTYAMIQEKSTTSTTLEHRGTKTPRKTHRTTREISIPRSRTIRWLGSPWHRSGIGSSRLPRSSRLPFPLDGLRTLASARPKDKIAEQNLLHSAMLATDDGPHPGRSHRPRKPFAVGRYSPAALLQLAQLEMHAENYAKAATYFRQAAAQRPENANLASTKATLSVNLEISWKRKNPYRPA